LLRESCGLERRPETLKYSREAALDATGWDGWKWKIGKRLEWRYRSTRSG